MKLRKLESMGIWVDALTHIIYPTDEDGTALVRNGGLNLNEINISWYNYLDEEEKEYLLNLMKTKTTNS
jgi:hypothetical protein